MAEEEGFFSRWSRRKAQARQETPQGQEDVLRQAAVTPPKDHPFPPSPASGAQRPAAVAQPPVAAPAPLRDPPERPAEAAAPPLPTLDDVRDLTPDADFSRFVAPEVSPEVRNAAMKKLFSDPFFNQMDGLDIYIDDYSKPDPLPASLARKLVSAQFMKLFEEPQAEQDAARVSVPSSATDPGPAPGGHPPEADAPSAPEPTPPSDTPPHVPRQP